ncbi:MAG TPA: PQQ-dependent sugar dehydrogenase [Gemmatimonadota bacterium]|nr:PQQ-dependent sugar dehydrogenase [Gemmatimonadota bacterium]
MSVSHVLVLALASLLVSCNGNGEANEPTPPDDPEPIGEPTLVEVADGLDFPVHLTSPPGDPRLFVVEKSGSIRVIQDGEVLPEPFLDLRAEVSRGSEQGLLSLAFHPDYASNGRFFVDYTNRAGDTRVVEYRVSADPDRADPAPVQTTLSVDQPFANHNGGLVVFGPDGMLYVGLGDGGSGGDPQGNGQNLETLLGKILRLDVDAGSPYAVPTDNPFTGQAGARGEIWAFGLRNPWRFSFDRETGALFIADVGQNSLEEVNARPGDEGGVNYGWNVMEGTECFGDDACDRTGLVLPVVEYDHGEGCSVTGGFVYRGDALPELQGHYFFSDFCSGFVRSFRLAGGAAVEERRWPELEPGGSVPSFGEDANGELYILTREGSVHRIAARP